MTEIKNMVIIFIVGITEVLIEVSMLTTIIGLHAIEITMSVTEDMVTIK